MKSLFAFCVSLLISTSAGFGHEFWILPEKYQMADGEPIVAQLVGGQKFAGSQFSFVPQRFQRFDIVQGDHVVPVTGRVGDRPAMNMMPPVPGLWVIVHETTDTTLTYKDWETFTGFVEHKSLGNTLTQHADRGLPDKGFKESYRRFVKALVAVGDGAGADAPVGLRTEIVALANPYVDDLAAGLPVQVLFKGAPRRDVQLEVFERAPNGQVAISIQRTDGSGRAVVAVKPGHQYLLDAVVMLPQQSFDATSQPVWRSLWAALTFAVPG